MTIKRFLIIAPALVSLVLLISYFWVPTYEEQTRGNPQRLEQFITASIGDATVLNPILSANSASSQIEGLVFEGLIDRDENLQYRGRVAERWRISEQAYFYVNDNAATLQWGALDGAELRSNLESALKADPDTGPYVTAVELLPAASYSLTRPIGRADQQRTITLKVQAPQRIRITLNRVDQLFFEHLRPYLGPDYFESFNAPARITAEPEPAPEQLAALAREILPATTHNPVIDFFLRTNVRFHDGQPLTAEDVKFTYEAIVNPENLSPRIPDYEPVKQVEIIDPHTVRIVYKRLYSPAIGTWAMGILPKHLLDETALAREAQESGQDPLSSGLRQSSFSRRPVGCGPFVFPGTWKSDQYIRLALRGLLGGPGQLPHLCNAHHSRYAHPGDGILCRNGGRLQRPAPPGGTVEPR
jgi:ABC-type transport system substrate-binding protein